MHRWLFALTVPVIPCLAGFFWENAGQLRTSDGQPCPEILFYADESSVSVFVRTNGLSYVFAVPEPTSAQEPRRRFLVRRVDIEWVGARPFYRWRVESPAPFVRHYYRPRGIATTTRGYAVLYLEELFPDVDLRLYWTERGHLKYDVLVRRAEALRSVRFRYIGAERLSVEADGSLRIGTSLGELRELPPIAYQAGRTLRGTYRLQGDTVVLEVPDAIPHLPLVFDPGVAWSTYYGGNQVEEFLCAATDRAGNVYTAGWSISPDFPVRNALQATLATTVASDAVIAAFSRSGQPLWVTYYGGDSSEVAYGISCDAAGNTVVVGTTTSPNFPVQNAFQSTLSGTADAFILRLTASGQRQWATYYGGSGSEIAYGVAYDRSGTGIFIGGSTSSTNFPLANALQTSHGGGTLDGFLVRFSAAGQRQWATYYGGSGEDIISAVAADSTGAVVAVGSTSSTNFPVQNALQPLFGGGTSDAFVLKLTGSGQRLWATYYGGNRQDVATAVAVDSRNVITFGGSTLSDTIPILNAVQPRRSAALDAFVTALDSAGRVLWGTFYGGSSMEEVRGIAVLRNRWVVACGYTYSSNFPRWQPLQPYAGGGDAFLVMFHYTGTLQWSTPFGGSGYEVFYSIAADSGVSIYACGSSSSSDYPTQSAVQSQLRGSSDAVLTRFDRETIRCRILRQPLCAGDTATVEFTTTGSFFPDNSFTAVLSDSSGDFARSTLIGELLSQSGGRIIVRIPDTIPAGKHYRIRVLASSPVTIGEPTDTLVILRPPVPPVITVAPDTVLCPGDSAVLSIAPEEMATYTWRRNNSPLSNSNSPQFIARQPGRYTVEVRTPCGTVTAVREVVLTAGTPPASPRIRVSGQTRFCRGDSIVLSTTPQPDVSYRWERNGQPFGTDSSAIVVREAGSYTLVVSNRCGVAPSRDTVYVAVDEPLAKPSISVTGATRFCQGDSAVLRTQPQPTAQEYRWYRDGVLVLRNPQAWSYTVRQAGWYAVELVNTCGSARSDSIAIEVIPLPTPPRITVEGGTTLCTGDSTVLLAEPQPGAYYRWYRNGQLADSSGPRYVVRQAGTYTVEVVTPCGHARSPDSVVIRVLDTLSAPQLRVDGSPELCQGDSLRLWVEPVSGARYVWYRDGTPIGGDSNATIVRSAGTYWVELSSPCGTVRSDSITVVITPRPSAPKLSVEGETRLCEGDSLRLSLGDPQPGLVYSWYRNDSLLIRDVPAIVVRTAGVYRVVASNRCGEAASQDVTVTVIPRPPKPSITQEGDTLVSSSPVGNQWLDSTGTPIPGAVQQRFVPPRSGRYSVRVTIDGCSSESDPYDFTRRTEPVVLRLRGAQAPPGTLVELPLLARIPATGIEATELRLTLRYWASVLEPVPPTPSGTVAQGWRRIPVHVSTAGLLPGDVVLIRLPFRVLLGDRDRTPLLLEELAWSPSMLPTEVVTDTFTVEICREGGDRLFVPTTAQAFVAVTPEPATAQATLRMGIPEFGRVRVTLWTLWGQQCAQLLDAKLSPGTYEMPLRLSGLPAGLYALTVQTPSQTLRLLFHYVP